MTRYFFHLHETNAISRDDEGLELGTFDEAIEVAIANARDVMVGELQGGQIDLSWSIAITNDKAAELAKVYFRDAVSVSA